MTTIIPPGITPTGETIVREIDGVGVVRFENYAAGEWMTKKGEPAKTSRRRYLLNDEEVDGVSSFVGALDKPALMRWIEDQATRGAVQAERMGELEGVPEDDWCERVRFLNLGASAKRDEGADRGTVLHTAYHSLAVEGKVPNPSDFPGVARPWLRGAMGAWLAMDPEPIASEEIVANPVHLYAGRPDLVAMVDGKVTLIDYKSGKGRVFPEAHFQTRLYSMALSFCGVDVEQILIVGIDDDGGFQLVHCAASERAAEALIAVYRARKAINADMAAQRRIAKAAA